MAEENDQETTDASTSGDASARQSYRDRLTELHDSGELGDSGYEHRNADVTAAATWGDLERAIAGLDRGDLPVPTRRRQRRELPDEVAATTDQDESAVDADTAAGLADDDLDDDADLEDDAELDDDDELDDDADLDDDDEELDEDAAELDEDAAELDDDEDLGDDETDLDDDDDELDDDLDDDEAPAATRSKRPGKAVAKAPAKDAKAAARSTKSGSRTKKNRPTPKRPTAVREPERTGPIQFIKESIEELRKVVYPTSSQLGTYFVVVLVFVLFVIGFTSGIDYGFGQLVLLVFG